MLATAEPREEPIVKPSNYWFMTSLKLKSIVDVAICISSINTACGNGDGLNSPL